ncbi:MAG: glycosyltransferase family 1 protein [wastewater metagenome]|nr:glycosyltransferase family 1 protein [Candidatus Loosdrechtia aerotolerans]
MNSNRRRIAFISEHASPVAIFGSVDCGGQNIYINQLTKNLAALGYEIDIFTRRDNKHLPRIYEWIPGVRVIYVPAGPAKFIHKEELFPYMVQFTHFMLQFIKKNQKRYDIIHANFWMSGLVAMNLKRLLKIPFVITFHALGHVRRMHQRDADKFPEVRFAIEEEIMKETDYIIAECPQDREDMIHLYHNADPEKITIIPCGFDPSELWPIKKNIARTALWFKSDEKLILHLGRMVPRKGVDNVIRSFSLFIKHYNIDAQLIIGGGEALCPEVFTFPEIIRLRTIASEEGILHKIHFTGQLNRNELKYYYSAADMFVTTPWYEPFGITPLEAMACGTPVIGSNVGGIKYTVVDSETGFLVPANCPEALAERIACLYKRPALRKTLQKQAIKRVNDFFTWGKIARDVAILYEKIIQTYSVKFNGRTISLVKRII